MRYCLCMNNTEYHNIIKSHGFAEIETGGGCTAFSKLGANGEELLITAQDDPSIPSADEVAIVSRNGEVFGEYSAHGLTQALAHIK